MWEETSQELSVCSATGQNQASVVELKPNKGIAVRLYVKKEEDKNMSDTVLPNDSALEGLHLL